MLISLCYWLVSDDLTLSSTPTGGSRWDAILCLSARSMPSSRCTSGLCHATWSHLNASTRCKRVSTACLDRPETRALSSGISLPR
jgi:hypothetical protein